MFCFNSFSKVALQSFREQESRRKRSASFITERPQRKQGRIGFSHLLSEDDLEARKQEQRAIRNERRQVVRKASSLAIEPTEVVKLQSKELAARQQLHIAELVNKEIHEKKPSESHRDFWKRLQHRTGLPRQTLVKVLSTTRSAQAKAHLNAAQTPGRKRTWKRFASSAQGCRFALQGQRFA